MATADAGVQEAQKQKKFYAVWGCPRNKGVTIIAGGEAHADECCAVCHNPRNVLHDCSPRCGSKIKPIKMISILCPREGSQLFYERGTEDSMPDPFVHCQKKCGKSSGQICPQGAMRITI